MKQTEIGKIPEDWEVVEIDELLNYTKGKKPRVTSESPINSYLPYLSTEYLRNNGKTIFCKVSGYEVIVDTGELILLWDGSNAGEFFIGKKGILSSTMVKFSLKRDIDQSYLFYVLKTKEGYLRGQTKGTGIPHVDKAVLNSIKIPLPILLEQKAIAEVLSTVDEAIQSVDRQIEKTERLKSGVMQKLLTKGIGHKEFKETDIGKIPEVWEVKKLGDVLEMCQYGLSTKLSDIGKYPIVKMDNIENGEVILKNAKRIDLDEKTFNNFKLKSGDILFNRTNSYELVGRTGIFLSEKDCVFASYLIRLRVKSECIYSSFLTYLLIHFNSEIRKLASRAVSQANINATNLQKFLIKTPPLQEQIKISEINLFFDKKLSLQKTKKQKLEKIKHGLMNDLLTGKKRVNVAS